VESSRLIFHEYLDRLGLKTQHTTELFHYYHQELVKLNHQINLYSRQMSEEEIWCKHFLDSLSIFEVYRDFAGKTILDFGTGGGFPGLPLKIVAGSCYLTLLDGTKKKIAALKSIVRSLGLKNVEFLSYRLEDKNMEKYFFSFDLIVCRSVRITPLLRNVLCCLLKPQGKIFLYKAQQIEDVLLFKRYQIHELKLDILGTRKIIEIDIQDS